MARDLNANRGKSLVIAGDTQPAEVHALAHLINHSLGNTGKTVEFFPRADAGPGDQIGSLRELASDMRGRRGRDADHPGRQPGLRRAGGSRLCRGCWHQRRPSCEFTSGSTTTRRPGSATGTFPRPIAWKRGATCGRSTARRRFSSR